ncbi:MAG: serine hydrolase domain-containing protein, partial [Acidimicrobiales bacterium]
ARRCGFPGAIRDDGAMLPGARDRVDAQLSGRLKAVAGWRRGHLAASIVDLSVGPAVRYAVANESDASRLFEIGSITKGLTGLLLADAIERDEIRLRTTVAEILPEAVGTALGSVTVTQLCTHTSGLPRLARSPATVWRGMRYAYVGLDPYRGLTPERVLDVATRQRLRRPEYFRYSNLGAAVCGQLVARAAGLDYPTLLHQRVLAPLAMTDTGISDHTCTAPAGRSGFGMWRQPWIMDGYAPAGGVISTITDMSRLAAGLLTNSAPGMEALKEIEGVRSSVRGRKRGMFWVIDEQAKAGQPRIWHNGATGGYSAFLVLVPETRRAVIVLSGVSRASRTTRIAADLAASISAGDRV